MKSRSILKQENGSIMVIGMLVMVMLTVAGIAATTISTVETEIATNERGYKDEVYRAEAAAMQVAQQLEEAVANVLGDKDYPNKWLRPSDEADMLDIESWDLAKNCVVTRLSTNEDNYSRHDPTISKATVRYSSKEVSIAPGGSQDMTKESNLYLFELYGLCEDGNRHSMVKLGYLLRY